MKIIGLAFWTVAFVFTTLLRLEKTSAQCCARLIVLAIAFDGCPACSLAGFQRNYNRVVIERGNGGQRALWFGHLESSFHRLTGSPIKFELYGAGLIRDIFICACHQGEHELHEA